MATSDMYKNSYTGKDNYIYLNDSTSAAKFPGVSIFADGAAYTSDGSEWGATTIKSYTADTLPDPASLGVGATVVVDGVLVRKVNSTDFKREDGKKIAWLRFGQSNERGSVYPTLIYTSSSIVGNGTTATLTTSVANDLVEGETYIGTISSAAPSGFNVTTTFTVSGGTYPNKTLTFPSSVVGSATTQGTLVLDIVASVPQAFKSTKKPSLTRPVAPALTPNGSMDFRVVDRILNERFTEIVPINACVGSLSFVKQAAGQIDYWNATSAYYNKRSPIGGGDSGDNGSLIVKNNCLFQCTSGGQNRYAVYNGGPRIEDTSYRELDYVVAIGSGVSGATEPTWANAATVGSTITDGSLTWTNIAINVSTHASSAIKGLAAGEVCFEGRFGFDPLGLLKRAVDMGNRIAADCTTKVVTLSNGQSDTAATAAWYSTALNSIASFFKTRGWVVGIGLTCFNPKTTTSVYDSILVTGRNNALTSLAAFPEIVAGPDLYTALGHVAGTGGLFVQSDNAHVTEDLHLSARGMLAAADSYVDWFKTNMDAGLF